MSFISGLTLTPMNMQKQNQIQIADALSSSEKTTSPSVVLDNSLLKHEKKLMGTRAR